MLGLRSTFGAIFRLILRLTSRFTFRFFYSDIILLSFLPFSFLSGDSYFNRFRLV